ncbi:hypothetical protein GWK47_013646 [Chionoecetes opilio]|uniref:Uncharacterized protein n=1 Tax=Chionoecetes opilio TaxID=41210 RepID=A0A8J4XXQ8_CHIOP|nr:hypothetical protein GWK47_013646 [Chionoecetes opilio]
MSDSLTGEERCQRTQEVSSKLLESCSNIRRLGLGSTTWLRAPHCEAEHQEKKIVSVQCGDPECAGELLAPLLDVLYGVEKDSVVPLLTKHHGHVVPYLCKPHAQQTCRPLRRCSQRLFRAVGGYQYTGGVAVSSAGPAAGHPHLHDAASPASPTDANHQKSSERTAKRVAPPQRLVVRQVDVSVESALYWERRLHGDSSRCGPPRAAS